MFLLLLLLLLLDSMFDVWSLRILGQITTVEVRRETPQKPHEHDAHGGGGGGGGARGGGAGL